MKRETNLFENQVNILFFLKWLSYMHTHTHTHTHTHIYINIYIHIYIQGSLNKFPDFFHMGTFIDSTHMKL